MLASLEDRERLMERVETIVQERERLSRRLDALEFVEAYPSQANFVLVRLESGLDARGVYDRLAQRGIFVRYFDTARLRDCLRISVGLPDHTKRLLEALQELGGERGR